MDLPELDEVSDFDAVDTSGDEALAVAALQDLATVIDSGPGPKVEVWTQGTILGAEMPLDIFQLTFAALAARPDGATDNVVEFDFDGDRFGTSIRDGETTFGIVLRTSSKAPRTRFKTAHRPLAKLARCSTATTLRLEFNEAEKEVRILECKDGVEGKGSPAGKMAPCIRLLAEPLPPSVAATANPAPSGSTVAKPRDAYKAMKAAMAVLPVVARDDRHVQIKDGQIVYRASDLVCIVESPSLAGISASLSPTVAKALGRAARRMHKIGPLDWWHEGDTHCITGANCFFRFRVMAPRRHRLDLSELSISASADLEIANAQRIASICSILDSKSPTTLLGLTFEDGAVGYSVTTNIPRTRATGEVQGSVTLPMDGGVPAGLAPSRLRTRAEAWVRALDAADGASMVRVSRAIRDKTSALLVEADCGSHKVSVALVELVSAPMSRDAWMANERRLRNEACAQAGRSLPLPSPSDYEAYSAAFCD